MTTVCNKCGIVLVEHVNWLSSRKKYRINICIDCTKKYSAEYTRINRENMIKRSKDYRRKNHDSTILYGEKYRRAHGIQSMSENKECSSYLGCHIAERVLQRIFNNVTVMPPNNKGFDFICSRGKLIDVKSACIEYRTGRSDSWGFQIKNNKIADYFLCLAFDNRDNITPMHMWLLPAEKFNHLTKTRISKSTINKWDEYKLDISEVAHECIIMKNEHR